MAKDGCAAEQPELPELGALRHFPLQHPHRQDTEQTEQAQINHRGLKAITAASGDPREDIVERVHHRRGQWKQDKQAKA